MLAAAAIQITPSSVFLRAGPLSLFFSLVHKLLINPDSEKAVAAAAAAAAAAYYSRFQNC